MATAQATNIQQQLQQIYAHNQAVLTNTQWKWVRFGTTAGTNEPAFALGQSYEFVLTNTSAFLDKLRVWFLNVPIEVTLSTQSGSAAGENAGTIWAALGTIQVKLGQHVYQLRAGLIPLVLSTFQKRGYRWYDPGQRSYAYSPALYGSVNGSTSTNGVSTAAGTNVFTGYLDIPLAALEMVRDPDGVMPTLSNAGVSVAFTTVNQLAGTDALRYPFYAVNGATVTLGQNAQGTTGSIVVMGHVATYKTVFQTEALPSFIAGVGYQLIENAQSLDTTTDFFATFQGQSTNVKLVKSLVVVNNPGQLTGQFSDPTTITKLDLMYDKENYVTENGERNNPPGQPILNFMADQRELYGDLPPGVFVFDWSAGTDPEYPNNYGYLDLTLFKNAGILLSSSVSAWEPGAQVVFANMYLNPTLYTALA